MLPETLKTLSKIARTLASFPSVRPEELKNSQVNHFLDRLDKVGSELSSAMIAEGRGYEKPSETLTLHDPLAVAYRQIWETQSALRNEVARRYGPGAPSRLPTRRK